jgi:hypothetical protein
MPDFGLDGTDPQVGAMLSAVGDTVAEHLRPAGVDAIRAVVRRRRRSRAVAGGLFAVALLASSVVVFATADRGRSHTPPIGVDPSVSASASAPESRPGPSSTSPTPVAPDGRISLSTLNNATLQIPAWPGGLGQHCRQGNLRFVDGSGGTPNDAAGIDAVKVTGEPAYVDVDADGAEETAIVMSCHWETAVHQVVVFDRDQAGVIRTVGVVLTDVDATAKNGIDVKLIWGIAAGDGGRIRVDVGDYNPCCGTAAETPQHQWREYGWNGQRFVQTGGPRAFGPNPNVTDLGVSAADPVLTAQGDGTWRGQVDITIRNNGPSTVPATLTFGSSVANLLAGTCGGRTFDIGSDVACQPGTVKKGTSLRVTVVLTSKRAPTGTLGIWVNHVPAATGGTAPTTVFPDLDGTNQTVELTLRTG